MRLSVGRSHSGGGGGFIQTNTISRSWGGGFIQSKAVNELDAGRDRATQRRQPEPLICPPCYESMSFSPLSPSLSRGGVRGEREGERERERERRERKRGREY